MKLIRPFVFLFCLALMGIALSRLGERYYPIVGETAVQAGRGAEVLVVGSSHAAILTSETLGVPTLNLFTCGADAFEMAYLSDYAISKVSTLRLAIVVISPFSFMRDYALHDMLLGEGLSQRRVELYGQYPQWRIISGDYGNFLAGKLYPLITHDHWSRLFWSTTASFLPDESPEAATLSEVGKGRARMISEEYEAFSAVYDGDMEERTKTALLNLIGLLRTTGMEVVLFTPPYWHAYTSALDERILAGMNRSVTWLVKESGVPYLSYMTDERFVRNPVVFHDADHLSRNAEAFYSVLRVDLHKVIPLEMMTFTTRR